MKTLATAALVLLCAVPRVLAQGLFLNGGYMDYAGGTGPVTVTFFLTRTPDFMTVGSGGQQADSFQFWIGPTVVRGEEIHVSGDIPVRNLAPVSSDPTSGGWGTVRGRVPYTISGQSLQFALPASLVGVSAPFSYEMLVTRYGTMQGMWSGVSGGPLPVPEPGLTALVLTAGAALAGVRRGRKQ